MIITYDIDSQQPKRSKKKDFRSEITVTFKRFNRAYSYLSVLFNLSCGRSLK